MNINDVSLSAFTRMASIERNENAKIKLTDDGIKSTSFFTREADNHKAMGAFIDAIKKDLGSVMADMASTHIHSKLGENKPLTVRVVRETLDELTRTAHSQINARDKFLSGVDPQNCFDKSFDEYIDSNSHCYERMDADTKAFFKEAVKDSFVNRTSPGTDIQVDYGNLGQQIGGAGTVESTVFDMFRKVTAFGDGAFINKSMVEVCKSGLAGVNCGGALLQMMPNLKEAPQGSPATMDDVWNQLFKEPFPKDNGNMTLERKQELGEKLNARMVEVFNELSGGKGSQLVELCKHMSIDKGLDMLQKRSASAEDFPNFEYTFGLKDYKYNKHGEAGFVPDIFRRGDTIAVGRDGNKTSIKEPSSITIGGDSYQIGKNTNFRFQEVESSKPAERFADIENYKHAKPSSLSHAIYDSALKICGGEANRAQAESLCEIFTQRPTQRLFGNGIAIFKHTISETQYSEHCPTKINVTKQDNGTLNVSIESSDNVDAVRYAGYFKLDYEVYTDGSFKPTALNYMAEFGKTAGELADQIDSRTAERDNLLSAIDTARLSDSITESEKEQLLRRINLRS